MQCLELITSRRPKSNKQSPSSWILISGKQGFGEAWYVPPRSNLILLGLPDILRIQWAGWFGRWPDWVDLWPLHRLYRPEIGCGFGGHLENLMGNWWIECGGRGRLVEEKTGVKWIWCLRQQLCMAISGLSSYYAFLTLKKVSCIGICHYSWLMIFEYI